jgi:heat shock protein HtpX
MYIIDFFKKMFQKNNWIVLVYMVLNVVVSALFITGLGAFLTQVMTLQFRFNEYNFFAVFGTSALILLVIYLISLLVTLSPLGEAIVRLKYKCKKPERVDQINFLESVFQEVMGKAKAVDEHLDEAANIYIIDSPETTVFALGRKTLAFASGIFEFPQEKTKALLARELGHISQKDTDFLLLVMTGGFLVTGCVWIVRIALYLCLIPVFVIGGLFYLFGKLLALCFKTMASAEGGGFIGSIIDTLFKPIPWLAKKLFELINWLGKTLCNAWSKVGVAMVLKTRGTTEFGADEFAFNCGYGDTLTEIIANDDLADQSEGIFKDIVKAYPASDARIAKLQELGVEYSAY